MRYLYKCSECGTEREVQHSAAECDNHVEICYNEISPLEFCEGVMYRVIHPILAIWPGGKPSET